MGHSGGGTSVDICSWVIGMGAIRILWHGGCIFFIMCYEWVVLVSTIGDIGSWVMMVSTTVDDICSWVKVAVTSIVICSWVMVVGTISSCFTAASCFACSGNGSWWWTQQVTLDPGS